MQAISEGVFSLQAVFRSWGIGAHTSKKNSTQKETKGKTKIIDQMEKNDHFPKTNQTHQNKFDNTSHRNMDWLHLSRHCRDHEKAAKMRSKNAILFLTLSSHAKVRHLYLSDTDKRYRSFLLLFSSTTLLLGLIQDNHILTSLILI